MFLLSAQNNFYIVLGLYVEGHVKKIQVESYVFSWFPGLHIWTFFEKFTVEQVLKPFSGRKTSLKPPVFYCNSLQYDLEELRALS